MLNGSGERAARGNGCGKNLCFTSLPMCCMQAMLHFRASLPKTYHYCVSGNAEVIPEKAIANPKTRARKYAFRTNHRNGGTLRLPCHSLSASCVPTNFILAGQECNETLDNSGERVTRGDERGYYEGEINCAVFHRSYSPWSPALFVQGA